MIGPKKARNSSSEMGTLSALRNTSRKKNPAPVAISRSTSMNEPHTTPSSTVTSSRTNRRRPKWSASSFQNTAHMAQSPTAK